MGVFKTSRLRINDPFHFLLKELILYSYRYTEISVSHGKTTENFSISRRFSEISQKITKKIWLYMIKGKCI